MRRFGAVAIRVERSSQAVINFPGPSHPGLRIRRILHIIGPFDPDERLITLRGTFGSPLFSGAKRPFNELGRGKVPTDEPASLMDTHPPRNLPATG